MQNVLQSPVSEGSAGLVERKNNLFGYSSTFRLLLAEVNKRGWLRVV